ncbi:MAG: mobile mystery protein B [Bacteroidota bacterium]
MGLELDYTHGQTPIEEEEKAELLIPTISTKKELDEFEQKNIEESMQWLLRKKFTADQVFTEKFIKELHGRMFGHVWRWAGTFRLTQKNIGVDYWQISLSLKMLLDDAITWYKDSVFEPDELAIRFKHRLVSIHCFPNGNGRHSRLLADLIIEKIFTGEVFSWGSQNLSSLDGQRDLYIRSLKAADQQNIRQLISFARS